MDPRKLTARHIRITLSKMKDKERIFKAAREKETVTYKGVPRRLSADFSKETLQARKGWKEVKPKTTEPKKQKQKQTKETIRTGTDSEKWTSQGGISVGRAKGGIGGEGIGKKQHN